MRKNVIDANKIGISTNVFKNPANMSELVGMLAVNFDTVEIEIENQFREVFNTDKSALEGHIAQINYIKDFVNPNLHLSLHAPYTGEICDIANESESIRKKALAYMVQSLEFASQISATKVTMHPGYIGDQNSIKKKLPSLDKSLKVLNSIAQDLNIDILLENTGDDRPSYILLNDEMHMNFCEKYNKMFLTVDLVHYNTFHRFSENFREGLKKMMPYIKNAHFADILGKEHRHLPLGFGDLDYKSDLVFMVENGYMHNFIVEETVKDHFNYEYLKEALNFKQDLKLENSGLQHSLS